MTKGTIGISIVISLLIITPLDAGDLVNVIYVDHDAPGSNNGTSWFHAFNYLQDALASAKPGCEIRVAHGTYYPNQSALTQLPGGRIIAFQLVNGVSVLGGYAGYGTPKPWERDVTKFETILSGDLQRNDGWVNPDLADAHLLDGPNRQDNAYSVVSASGVEATAVLDGFTVLGGNANLVDDKYPYSRARGGGLYAYGGHPKIRNCIFKSNAAVGGGGGIYNYMTEASYENCTVFANYSAAEGAGMSNMSSDPDVSHCTFIKNRVYIQGEGGGMYNYDSNPVLHKCVFTGNDGGYHGGGLYNAYSDAVVTQCQFINNKAHQRGGAVYNATGSVPEFTDCKLINNQAPEWGGGMVNYYCAPRLINCVLHGNEANLGAGLYNRYSDPVIINCLFRGNTGGPLGGAIGCHDTDLQVINCTFWSNHANQGRSIACASAIGPSSTSRLRISNSILWNPGNEIFNGDHSQITVRYSNVHGGWPGTGNIQANPLFHDQLGPDHIPGTEDDNLRLALGSPCIDAADNAMVPSDVTTDLDDTPRFHEAPLAPNTGHGKSPVIDMGAYEFKQGHAGSGQRKPVAHAGPDQTVYARVNGQATVNLDGSGSYDIDGDALQYFWHWTVEGTPCQAEGMSPQVQMPEGVQHVQLIVNDGSNFSDPDHATIKVIEPLQADTWIWPYEVSRTSPESYINVYLSLVGITQEEVDLDKSLILYPGTLKATYMHTSQTNDGLPTTTLFAMFDKQELLDVVPQNGTRTLTVAGRLKSGQYISGQDQVEIVP